MFRDWQKKNQHVTIKMNIEDYEMIKNRSIGFKTDDIENRKKEEAK